jgi:DNA-binding transcriptional ArsR family regulator
VSVELMSLVWERSDHKGSELLTLLAIADNANDETAEAYPSLSLLSTKTRLAPRSIQYVLDKLYEGGELELVKRGRWGVANLYRINTQALRHKAAKVSAKEEPKLTVVT